jgi:high-affinity nickel permease
LQYFGEVEGLDLGLIAATLLLGLRHGLDWDHIAAISDIAGSQSNTRRSIVLSMSYAVGHGLMVLVLGALAIAGGRFLPDAVDTLMQPVVGITLIGLGVYLLYSLARRITRS